VDCLKGQARLDIRDSTGKLSQLLVVDPQKIVIMGGGEQSLGCGPQKPPKRLKVDYAPKSNPKLGTIGEAGFIEFTP
jgi:hypothetical protein